MSPILLYPAVAAVSAVLVAGMIRVGALDHPVERSSHVTPTPKGGGVGIVMAFALGMLLLYRHGNGEAIGRLILASAAVFLGIVSFLDDLFDWPFFAKLEAQAFVALSMIAFSAVPKYISSPDNSFLVVTHPAWLAPLFALGWFVFVTNAVNFMDGLNGLASGSIAMCMLALAAVAPPYLAVMAMVLAAAIAGFLPFNYPRARIFMGDVGSQVCGFLAAAMALFAADQPNISITIPLALLPMLLDVAFTLVRRARQGARLTQAHRGHLYQVANRAGTPAWRVTLVYWVLAAWGGVLGLATGAAGYGPWSIAVALGLAVMPFAAWGVYVGRTAKRAGITMW